MINNSATMREALDAVVEVGYPHNFQREAPHISGYCYDITKAIKKCFAALSEPPRNCDRFVNETVAQIAFLNEVCFIGVTTLRDDPFDCWTNLMKERYAKWLLAPAAERKGEGK